MQQFWLWAAQQWCCSSDSTAISTSLTEGCMSVRALHTGKMPKKGNVMALFHKRKLCRYVLKYLRERACPSDGFREVFAQKKRKEMAVQLLFSLWGSSCLPCWQLEEQTKANILKQEWLKSKAVWWLFEAAYLLFSHMRGINPLLDWMCQNELCLEGTSEPAQKFWPDKHKTQFGISFFSKCF